MTTLTLVWIVLPLFLSFGIYLLPVLDRYCALGVTAFSAAYGLWLIAEPSYTSLQLINSFGVSLVIDQLSGYFILTNALVTAAVVLYCWDRSEAAKVKTTFFFSHLLVLHGCVNAVFICADFMSLYVALEVVGVAVFLLVTYPRSDKTIWLGLRYLMVSNTAMLFYLLGAVLVYQANQSFAFTGLETAPKEAIALIFLGLLTKGGVFVSGLWLPATHAGAEAPVSALLSGVVSKTGIFPLVRCALLVTEMEPIVQIFGIGSAILGVSGAILATDTKRMLAFSTLSQVGFVLAAPAVAGFYALTHGLAKATLFLSAGSLPARDFKELKQTPMQLSMWIVIAIAGLSLSGFPLIAGFDAKVQTLGQLSGWQAVVLNTVSVGTVIAFAKFIFLPFTQEPVPALEMSGEGAFTPASAQPKSNSFYWIAVVLLLGTLLAASALHSEDYTATNLAKSLGKIGIGWLVYLGCSRFTLAPNLFNRLSRLRTPEKLEHLVGGMSLVLILLFWQVLK